MTSWHHGEEVKVWQDEDNTQGVRRMKRKSDRRHRVVVGGNAMKEKEMWEGGGRRRMKKWEEGWGVGRLQCRKGERFWRNCHEATDTG